MEQRIDSRMNKGRKGVENRQGSELEFELEFGTCMCRSRTESGGQRLVIGCVETETEMVDGIYVAGISFVQLAGYRCSYRCCDIGCEVDL
jgi:hypothetical protein